MRYIRLLGLLAGLTLVGACSKPAEGAYEDAAVSELVAPSPKDASQQMPGQELSLPQLAYAYSYGIETPASTFDDITRLHQVACDKAGPQHCIILSADSYGDKSIGELRKTLTLRVSPSWLKTFQAGLDSDLSKTRSQIRSSEILSEDLSLKIVDSEARLKNKMALRDRLIDIIKSRPGKIAELIEAESTLSDTQAEIDSLQSSLAVMRKRVATVSLTLKYVSEIPIASRSAFSPVITAFKDFTHVAMSSLGAIILVIAALLPFGLIIVPLGWFGWRLWRKRKAKSKPTAG